VKKSKDHDRVQFGALPFRVGPDGKPQVLLLTSRETKRWVIPKGWPIHGKKPREVATQEAFEEAGLLGTLIGKKPVGHFHYAKVLPSGDSVLCQVKVFLLLVDQQLNDWPEREQRETRWFNADEAAGLVEEGGLAEIVLRTAGWRTAFK
jgi:8-oxo-dGTP pyrophosphatase MutT (NUDIX family)